MKVSQKKFKISYLVYTTWKIITLHIAKDLKLLLVFSYHVLVIIQYEILSNTN